MDIKSVLGDFLTEHSKCEKNSPLVLIWELGGFSRILVKNAIYSAALKTRGYDTHFIICDGTAQACIQRGLEHDEKIEDWPKKCTECISGMRNAADQYNVNYSFVSDYISLEQRQKFQQLSQRIELGDIKDYKYAENNVGVLAWNSLNRYMKGHVIELKDIKNREDKTIYRRYFYAALVHTYVAIAAIQKFNPVSILTSHGNYVDYAPPISQACLKGLNYVAWHSGYADFLHYYSASQSTNEAGLRAISRKQWQKVKATSLTDSEEKRLDDYMYDRYFKDASTNLILKAKPESLRQKLHIDNDNPIVALFAHVNWDACLGSRAMLFNNVNQWLVESIKKMSQVKDVNWIIKMHPGEVRNGTLFTSNEVIQKELDFIPGHIKVVENNTEINSYGLYQLIDAGITIRGTVGAELPLSGKPIITTGEAHFSGKGFSIDAQTKEHYFSILENIKKIKPLTEEQIKTARRYAYYYFIQRQIPLDMMDVSKGHWGDIDLAKLDKLLPGNDPAMDKICHGIIHGKDIVLDRQTEDEDSGIDTDTSGLKEVYSADQQGKVIIGSDKVFRIIHKNEEEEVRKMLDLAGADFGALQVVDTKILADKNIFKSLNVPESQLVLAHKRISNITYSHEWSPSMLQDAALYHLKLSASLVQKGLTLKDAHPWNILFDKGRPVFIDVTSIITKEGLFNESYLNANSLYKDKPENIRICALILEIYERMFLPYFYIPLCGYAFGNRQIVPELMYETAMNTSTKAASISDAVNEYQLTGLPFAASLEQLTKIFETFASDMNLNNFFYSLHTLIEQLPVTRKDSGYADYYEAKGENQNYTQASGFNEKQKTVFESLNRDSINSVLDMGSNTGWYSLMAEHMGKEVTAFDIDTACVERLYDKVKQNKLNIHPIVADFTKITPQRLSVYDDKPVMLDGFDRLGCDSVLVLALLHHLVLGLGMTFDEIFSKISLLTKKQLVLEYVSIDDQLIQAQPDFFPAFHKNPGNFGFYNLDNLLRTLRKFYSNVEVKWSTQDTRMILIANKQQDEDSNIHQVLEVTKQPQRKLTRVAILADNVASFTKIQAEGLQRMFEQINISAKIFYDGRAAIRQNSNIEKQLSLFEELRNFDLVVVAVNMPGAFLKETINDKALRQYLPETPIVLYDNKYLATNSGWARYFKDGAPEHQIIGGGHWGLERYDWHLAGSVVTCEPMLPPGAHPYSLVGVNLNDGSLFPEQKDFIALIDFERSHQLEERKIQIQACEETNTKYIILKGGYSIEDIRKIYKMCSIYFVAHSESFGLPICELQACGSYIFTPYSRWCRSHYIKADVTMGGGNDGTLSPNFVSYDNDKDKLVRAIQHTKHIYDPRKVVDTFLKFHPQLFYGDPSELQKFVNMVDNGIIHSRLHTQHTQHFSLDQMIKCYREFDQIRKASVKQKEKQNAFA